MGGTAVSFEALRTKNIDICAEYSGTISSEILKMPISSLDSINEATKKQFQLEISKPYGFNNTYAIIVKADFGKEISLKTLADLVKYPELRAGLSYEFLKRQDGWEGLAKIYQLAQKAQVWSMGLSYQALLNNEIDFTDANSTDGEMSKYGFITLEDNLNFFPKYEAVSFFQMTFPPKAKELIQKWIIF